MAVVMVILILMGVLDMTVGDGMKVDVHHHFIPEFYAQYLTDSNTTSGGIKTPAWDVASDLQFMDTHGIATAYLSITSPGVYYPGVDEATSRSMARSLNEYAAALVKENPGRYGFFAVLTLPDMVGAQAEAVYALDTLQANGVVLYANTAGMYLGNRQLDPLYIELNARSAVVFVHPDALPGGSVPEIPAFLGDFLLDTVRAANNLVASEILTLFPHIKWILPHGGGFLPCAAMRSATILAGFLKSTKQKVLDDMREFYFDTATVGGDTGIAALTSFANPDHVLFGSDYPYARATTVQIYISELDNFKFSSNVLNSIYSVAAMGLLGKTNNVRTHLEANSNSSQGDQCNLPHIPGFSGM